MKIVIVNRNFFITGGPENYMFSLMENMPQHKFIPFCVDFDQNIPTPFREYFITPPVDNGSVYFKDFKMSTVQKITYAYNTIYHREARRKLEKLIKSERPDVAIFLNAVYFSESIIDACKKYNIPIIWRLSDFNKICANYLLYRDGHICEDCLTHGIGRAIRNRCGGYQRSLSAAIVKVVAMGLSRLRQSYDYVDYFITPSAFTRSKMIEGGFNPEKIIHLPTFITVPNEGTREFFPSDPTILYVGRISPEKGVNILIDAFNRLKNKKATLLIAGNDSSLFANHLKAGITDDCRERIIFLGIQNRERLAELYLQSTCVVVPSVWYENQPNVVLEAMAHSRPVVAACSGSLEEMISHMETGLHFKSEDPIELANAIDFLLSNPSAAKKIGRNALAYVRKNHSPILHLNALEILFDKVKASSRKHYIN